MFLCFFYAFLHIEKKRQVHDESSKNIKFFINVHHKHCHLISLSSINYLNTIYSTPQHILSTFFGHLLCCLSYAPLLVAMVLSRICFTFVISSRTYLMGTLWFTKLDESNQYAVAARNTGVPSFIMYFISMVFYL